MIAALAVPMAVAQAASAEAPGPAAVTGPPVGNLPATPTTRILLIGHMTRPPTQAELQSVMPGEVKDTVALYLSGKIADWYVRKDKPGVVFLMNVTDVGEARDLVAKLPLVRSGMMEFEFIPVGPLSPLALLLK